jgi:hypothetical protein
MERQRDNRERRPSAPSLFNPIAGRSRGERPGESVQREPQRVAPQRAHRAAPARMSSHDSLLRQLTSRRALRQAILLREIIGPPKALRGPADS